MFSQVSLLFLYGCFVKCQLLLIKCTRKKIWKYFIFTKMWYNIFWCYTEYFHTTVYVSQFLLYLAGLKKSLMLPDSSVVRNSWLYMISQTHSWFLKSEYNDTYHVYSIRLQLFSVHYWHTRILGVTAYMVRWFCYGIDNIMLVVLVTNEFI